MPRPGPISPRTLPGRPPAQEAKVISITQDTQGHGHSEARTGAQAPPCPGGPGVKAARAKPRAGWGLQHIGP